MSIERTCWRVGGLVAQERGKSCPECGDVSGHGAWGTLMACAHCGAPRLLAWGAAEVGGRYACAEPRCARQTMLVDVVPGEYVRGRAWPDASDVEGRDATIAALRAQLAVARSALETLRNTVDAGPTENSWIDRVVTEALAEIDVLGESK